MLMTYVCARPAGRDSVGSLPIGSFLIGQWLPAVEHTVRSSTFTSYRSHVRVHIAPVLGRVPLEDLQAIQLNGLYVHLLGSKRLSPSTVRRVHATLPFPRITSSADHHHVRLTGVQGNRVRWTAVFACDLDQVWTTRG